ncbi:DNA-directed RNA polymerases II, IV and V subunit 9B [Abrus precatorius]|uniref:DNA-directed RNA polymerase subunit n=1 Tax=Abrus precatorius TaxID=3816 RepID=A0A8B8JSG6_ABRPR|nr:DNA-directed RNA polymerases II, IV and V subunit 9B [Abrus precatorius]
MSDMKFCCKCNNLLYPKENKEQRILLYACRTCDHEEIADSNIVYRNEIRQSVERRPEELENIASDPTLPRTKSVRCSKCNNGEAVFFRAKATGEDDMSLVFVCSNLACSHRWKD